MSRASFVRVLAWVALSACAVASAARAADKPAATPEQLALGKKLFSTDADPSCAACHTLKDAGAEGQIGPILDDLKPDAGKVTAALRNGMGANMPSYKTSLTEAQIQAISLYVSTVTGGQ